MFLSPFILSTFYRLTSDMLTIIQEALDYVRFSMFSFLSGIFCKRWGIHWTSGFAAKTIFKSDDFTYSIDHILTNTYILFLNTKYFNRFDILYIIMHLRSLIRCMYIELNPHLLLLVLAPSWRATFDFILINELWLRLWVSF